jgi:uncharacterized membrane protein YedE/YeeE
MHANLLALLGGALIGTAISLMLLLNGRVTGVSGIVGTALKEPGAVSRWRWAFLGGLFCGGLLLRVFYPAALQSSLDRGAPMLIVAGLLVGFGTLLGNGCTSGHGICGLARLSKRSVAATLVFMAFGVLAATLVRVLLSHWFGSPVGIPLGGGQ